MRPGSILCNAPRVSAMASYTARLCAGDGRLSSPGFVNTCPSTKDIR